MSNLAEKLRSIPKEQLIEAISALTPKQQKEIRYDWSIWARDDQIPPQSDWNTFLALAGRGWGKTKAAAEWVREQVKRGHKRIAYVCAVNADIEKVFVKGESGILNCCWEGDKTHSGIRIGNPIWSPTKRTITWYQDGDPNKKEIAQVQAFSAEEPDRLRGPQFSCAACDELCAWNRDEETWDMLAFTLRLGKHPQVFIATTPRPTKLIRKIMKDEKTLVVRGSTFDNTANLSDVFLEQIKRQYEGTRLGKQELYAELLLESEGALWTADMIDRCQISIDEVPDLVRVVVAVDPATTSNVESDSTGIIVAGVDINGIGYVLGDYTMKDLPEKWVAKAVSLYGEFGASRIVYEKNQGGDMIPTLFRVVDENIPLRGVHASVAKIARAEPVSALYERDKVKHVRNPKNGASLTELETQMTTFEPFSKHKSPDRYDACLAKGTLIHTKCGNKPIELVTTEDQVLTRGGYKPVLWAGKTRKEEKVLEIVLSNGYVIKATPEHPFYVKDYGWVMASELVEGDALVNHEEIESWNNTRLKLSGTEKLIEDTQIAKIRQSKGITPLRQGMDTRLCTETFGSFITDQFLKDSTFTTKMETTSTTKYQILNVSPPKIMRKNTKKNFMIPVLSAWTKSAYWLLNGTALQRVWSSIQSLASNLGKIVFQNTLALVKHAESLSWHSLHGQSIALKSASTNMSIKDIPSQQYVQSAAKSFNKTNTEQNLQHAPVYVVQVSESKEKADVYNLHVKDQHEFTACGVLTHNCVWALTDLMLKGWAKPQLALSYESRTK